jgi:peptide/nickel transport system permease protein
VLDTSTLVLTAVAAAIPAFVAAIVLILAFAVQLRWFPCSATAPASRQRQALHPACLRPGLLVLAIVARVTRAAVREEHGREHVQTATSRGIPVRQVIGRPVLRNAAIPITTTARSARTTRPSRASQRICVSSVAVIRKTISALSCD